MSVSLRSQLVSGLRWWERGAIALTPIQPAIAPAVSPARISSPDGGTGRRRGPDHRVAGRVEQLGAVPSRP